MKRVAGVPVRADELSGEACFAWAITLVERDLAQGIRGERYRKFLAIFRRVFNREFDQTPRTFWVEIYGEGLVELADLGLVELERDGVGDYVITAVHEDLYVEGRVDIQ